MLDLDQRLRVGDGAALAQLVEQERARLLRTVRVRMDVRLNSRVEPDDVLQEAFLAARSRLAHYAADGFTRPYTWLRLIVLQTLADLHRHHLGAQMRDAGREAGLVPLSGEAGRPLADLLSGSVTSPSGAVIRREASAHLAKAIAQLSEADREIISLRHFEDLANEEVAEALGIQPKAASIRYVRAIRRLGELLAAEGLSFGDLHVRR